LKTIILILIAFVFNSPGFSKDPDLILKNVQKKFNEVKDYEVDVHVKVDVDLLKVPESNAKFFFKHPDKVKIKSENFAMLPKEGMNFLPQLFTKKDYTSIFVKEDMLEGIKVSIIKLIPLNESSDILLSTLWIDETRNIIRKAEVSTKLNGVFNIELTYDNSVKGFDLPESMKFTFNLSNIDIPKISGNEMGGNEPPKRKTKKPTKGMVMISYSNYKVNKGIPDSFFTEKKK
jgi:hypothetical protein